MRPGLPSLARAASPPAGVGTASKNEPAAPFSALPLPVGDGPAPILLLAAGMAKRRVQAPDPGDRIATDLDEIHGLLEGFEQELRKLDEALETLSAYLLRLQCQPLTGRTLH
jgi:hypothetical protein